MTTVITAITVLTVFTVPRELDYSWIRGCLMETCPSDKGAERRFWAARGGIDRVGGLKLTKPP